MAEERTAFAFQVVPLADSEGEDPYVHLTESAVMLAYQLVNRAQTPVEQFQPLLLVQFEEDTSMVFWPVLSVASPEDFFELVVPETLASVEPDMAALLVATDEPQAEGGSVPAIVMFSVDRCDVTQPVYAHRALVDGPVGTQALGEFRPVAGGCPPQIAQALRRPDQEDE
jgi:hypothetical protein